MDETRLEELLREVKWMRMLSLHLARDSEAAGDLLQDTWVNLLRKPPAGQRPVRAWIYTVMANLARNQHRGKTRRVHRESEWARTQDPLHEDVRSVEQEEALSALRVSLRLLTDAQQALLELRFHDELTPKQIAEQTGVPSPTVRTRLKRALDAVRIDMDGRYGGERRAWGAVLLAFARSSSRPPLDGVQQQPGTATGESSGWRPWRPAGAWPVFSGVAMLVIGASTWLVADAPLSQEPFLQSPIPLVVAPDDTTRDVHRSALAALLPESISMATPLGSQTELVPPVTHPATAAALSPGTFVVRAIDADTGDSLHDLEVRVVRPNLPSRDTRALMFRHALVEPSSRKPFTMNWSTMAPYVVRKSEKACAYVSVKGYTWAQFTLSAGTIGPLTVQLYREARLWIGLTLPDATGSQVVRLSRPDGRGKQVVHLGQRGERHGLQWVDEWTGLFSGQYTFEVLCGHDSPQVLATQQITLESGRTQVIHLTVPPESRPPPSGSLSGTLRITHQERSRKSSIRLMPLGTSSLHGRTVLSFPVDPMPRADSALVVRHWSGREIPPGDYEALLLPYGLRQPVTIGAGSAETMDFDLPEIATVELTTVHWDNAEPIACVTARHGHPDMPIESYLLVPNLEGRPGHFTFWCPPGPLKVSAVSRRDGRSPAFGGWVETVAMAGLNRIQIGVLQNPSIVFRFTDGEKELDFKPGDGQSLKAIELDSIPFDSPMELPLEQFFQFDAEGRYRFLFDPGPAYVSVPTFEVDIRSGDSTEHTIHLHRR